MLDSYGDYIDDDDAFDPYEQTPGNDMDVEQGGGMMGAQQELPVEQKLQLAERANEIYRQQLKYMQDHLQSLRSLIQDKESIIENLMLRYDLGILQQDPTRTGQSFAVDEIDSEELRRKAEGLAQRTILENFELRELVNELRDENFHLRNEIYELQDKVNRQALHISKLSKENENQSNGVTAGGPTPGGPTAGGDDDQGQWQDYSALLDDTGDDNVHPAMTDEAIAKRQARQEKHNRRQSSIAAPSGFFDSVDADADDDEDDEQYMDSNALAKRAAREAKAHARKESLAIPDLFGDGGDSDDERANSEEAKKKRAARAAKANKKRESMTIPDLFNGARDSEDEMHPSQTEEAKRKREQRKHRKNKSSVQLPYGFFGDDSDSDQNEQSREKKRKHARKKSLMKAAGLKGHLSDEDTEKTKRVDYETRRQLNRKERKDAKHRKRGSVVGVPKGVTDKEVNSHTRDESQPIPDLGFDDPDVLLAFEKGRVQELTAELDTTKNELKKLKKQLEEQSGTTTAQDEVNESREALQNTQKLVQKLQEKVDGLEDQLEGTQRNLDDAYRTKVKLIELTGSEINRLTRVINALLQIDKCKDITRLLLQESIRRD